MSVKRKRLRARLALFLVAAMLLSLIPSTGVMAAEPTTNSSTMETKVPSLRILFSTEYYLQNNPDVRAAFGDDPILAYMHFSQYGIKEGRQYLTPILDVYAYRAGNPDLKEAFGNDLEKYLWHYINYGAQEIAMGLRAPAGVIFDPVKYLNAHPDLLAETGGNLLAAMEHYVTSGLPVGNWVNAQYTAGPAIAHSNESTGTDNSSSSVSSDAGNNNGNGANDGNSGSGGSSKPKPPVPDKPEEPPVDPIDPPVDPVEPVVPEHEHNRDSFNEDGSCKVEGCEYTLADLQRDCKMDHSAIELGHYCVVCGAEGLKDPDEEHTKDSVHTRNSFGDDGLCLWGCGLTLAEFQKCCTENHDLHIGQTCLNCGYEGTIPYTQDECPNKDNHTYGESCDFCDYEGECSNAQNHAALHKGQKCSECGFEGELDHAWDKATGECTGCNVKCSNIGNHADILQGETCEICGYEGTKLEVVVHPEGYTHNLSDFVGGKCGICGMTVDEFQSQCTEDHEVLHKGQTCENCGCPGEAEHKFVDGKCECGAEDPDYEVPFVCPNAANHVNLHEGVACGEEGCDYIGEAEHTFANGECTGCDATCTPETCPDKEAHKADAGYTCGTCGYKVPDAEEPDEPEQKHPEEYVHTTTDYENGICTTCGEPCPNTEHHGELVCGSKCPDCDYVDAVGHLYDAVTGVCSKCQTHCTEDDCPNRENHDEIECSNSCTVCNASMPPHNYVEQDGAWVCTRCNSACTHSFYHGKCNWCNATCNADTCAHKDNHGNLVEGELCEICGFVGVATETPAEHVHDWSAQDGTCAGTVGTCDGCPNAASHAEIPSTGKCETCGAAGTKNAYAYTPDNCPGHEYGEDGVCTQCGAAKPAEHVHVWNKGVCSGEGECPGCSHGSVDEQNVCTICGLEIPGFGEGEEEPDEEPAGAGEGGGTAAGGNTSGEDGADAAETTDTRLPDALPEESTTGLVVKVAEDANPDDKEEELDGDGNGKEERIDTNPDAEQTSAGTSSE